MKQYFKSDKKKREESKRKKKEEKMKKRLSKKEGVSSEPSADMPVAPPAQESLPEV